MYIKVHRNIKLLVCVVLALPFILCFFTEYLFVIWTS